MATAEAKLKSHAGVWSTVKPFVNGGASGMLATCVIQPIDMIKARSLSPFSNSGFFFASFFSLWFVWWEMDPVNCWSRLVFSPLFVVLMRDLMNLGCIFCRWGSNWGRDRRFTWRRRCSRRKDSDPFIRFSSIHSVFFYDSFCGFIRSSMGKNDAR